MTSSNFFSDCKTAEHVYITLKDRLCNCYLHETKCNDNFRRFKTKCEIYLTTPVDKSLSNPSEIWTALEKIKKLNADDFTNLEDIVKDIDDAMFQLIQEAQKKISSIEETGDDVKKLREHLRVINTRETKKTPVSPLQKSFCLPVEKLFTSMIFEEDLRYNSKKCQSVEVIIEKRERLCPKDFFNIDGEYTRRIFLRGGASRGKSTFCLWLMKQWCEAQQTSPHLHNELDKILKKFDFAFLLPMRLVDPTRVTLLEMLCKDALNEEKPYHKTIEHVLLNEKYRCLIIIDGLEEWAKNANVIQRLKCKALPNFDETSNCTYLITMRSWIFDDVAESIRDVDRVIELEGFDEAGITTVIENLLFHHYKLGSGTNEYEEKYNEIMQKIENRSLKSIMQIPLLAVLLTQILYQDIYVGESLGEFYANLVEFLLESACKKHDFQRISKAPEDKKIPNILSEKAMIRKFLHILLRLGQVAYKGLLDDKLVFQKQKLENEIGETELQFALDVGLISIEEAPSTITTNVSIVFFHASVQEYLAALYIVHKSNEKEHNLFSGLKVVIRFANVISFICGLNPSLAECILQNVVRDTNEDENIRKYRDNPREPNLRKIAYCLYKQQIEWYRELRYGLIKSKQETNIESEVSFHISDVFLLCSTTYENTVKNAKQMGPKNFPKDIKSLYFTWEPKKEAPVTQNTLLDDFLADKEIRQSLVMLFVYCHDTGSRSMQPLRVPTLRGLYLQGVKIESDEDNADVCPPLMKDMNEIRHLELWNMTVGNRGIGLSSDMVNVRDISLGCFKMSAKGWQEFLNTLEKTQHEITIKLFDTDIDTLSKNYIRSSATFKIDKNFDCDDVFLDFMSLGCLETNANDDDDDDDDDGGGNIRV